MKTLVVPIDFSPISLNAANYAAELARSIGADLSLLHICLVPITTYGEVPYAVEHMGSYMSAAEEKILQVMNDLEKSTAGKVKIDTAVQMAATVIGGLSNFCHSTNPYAVVMGSQGSSAIERVFFGSNTISAIRQLSCPVLAVPPGAKFATIRKIGLACDLEKVDENIPFKQIKSLVTLFNAQLYILHINAEGVKGFTEEKTVETRSIQNLLYNLHPIYRFLDSDDIETGLEEFAETNKLDLLITVPKRHSVIDKIFHESHTKKLVLHTRMPVMAIHD